MKAYLFAICLLGCAISAAEPKSVLEEAFTTELSKDWFWGLEIGRAHV